MGKKVTIYSTPTCPFCIRTKQFLKDNNVQFTDYDVGQDQEKAQEMMRKTGQMGVPVIDVEGQIIIGFDKERIKEALGI